MRLFTSVISIINAIFSFLLLIGIRVISCGTSNDDDVRFVILKTYTVILITFFMFNVNKTFFTEGIHHIRSSLEFFILLFILNIIPMITTDEDWSTNEKKIPVYTVCSRLFHVMVSLQIYGVYLYYKDELKSSRQNVLSAPPPYETLFRSSTRQRF